MGTVAAAAPIAGLNSPLISSPDNRQPPEDGYGGQNVHNFLSLKGLVDELRAALDDPFSGKYNWLKDCDMCSNV